MWMKIQFCRFLDEPVHKSGLTGKDLRLLEFGCVIMVDTVFGYGRFVWWSYGYVVDVLLISSQ